MAILCPPSVRMATLPDVVKVYGNRGRTIIFANTKAEAGELAMNSTLSNSKHYYPLSSFLLLTSLVLSLSGAPW